MNLIQLTKIFITYQIEVVLIIIFVIYSDLLIIIITALFFISFYKNQHDLAHARNSLIHQSQQSYFCKSISFSFHSTISSLSSLPLVLFRLIYYLKFHKIPQYGYYSDVNWIFIDYWSIALKCILLIMPIYIPPCCLSLIDQSFTSLKDRYC